jgi:hypothetical protein
MCIYDGITMSEFAATVEATFGRPIVGFSDENGITFPLSVVVRDPSLLANRAQLRTVSDERGVSDYSEKYLSRQNAVANLMDSERGESGSEYEEIDVYETGESEDGGSYEDTEDESNYDDLQQQMRPLSLEESIEEMNLLVGFGNVDVRTVLELLPPSEDYRNRGYGESEDWMQSLPLSVSREGFLELITVLASLVREDPKESPDEELINLLFDVLFNSSDVLSSDGVRRPDDEIDTTTVASGLTLLCAGDESANLAVVFSLYSKKDDLIVQDGRGLVPDVCVYLHLSACFRLVYQLCSALRKSASMQPEELAYTYSLGQFVEMTDREYNDGSLSFREFDACCKIGFRRGLFALHQNMRGLTEGEAAFTREIRDEIKEVQQLPSYKEDDEHQPLPHYDDSHHHETVLPGYEDSHHHESVGHLPPPVPHAHPYHHNMSPQPPAPPMEQHGEFHGSPHMHIHDQSLYQHYLQNDYDSIPAHSEADDDHDAHFPEGRKGHHYFHHSELSSDSDDPEDHEFPHGKHGVHFNHMDKLSAGNFFRSTVRAHEKSQQRQQRPSGGGAISDSETEGGNGDDDDNALEDSLVAASLVEYDGGPIDVLKAQQILGFKAYMPDVILSSLIYAASDDGDISLASYHRLFDQLMRKRYSILSVLQRSVADYIVSQIFDSFDPECTGFIKMEQLGWGLLIFCDGNAQLKARAATALMNSHVDTDTQGGLKAGDMIYCLSAVLKTVSALNRDFIAPLQPEQIANELTMYAFSHAGANYLTDDSIDVEDAAQYWQQMAEIGAPTVIPISDFEHWFGVTIAQFEFDGNSMSLPSDASLATTNSVGSEETSDAEEMSAPKLDQDMEMNSYGGLHSDASELRSSVGSATSDDSADGRGAYGAGWKRGLQIDTRDTSEEETGDDSDAGGGYYDSDTDASKSEDERLGAAGAVYPEETFLNYGDFPEFTSRDMDDSETSGSRAGGGSGYTSQSDVPSQSQSDYDETTPDVSTSAYDSESDAEGGSSSAVTVELRNAAELLGLDGFPADDLMEVLGESSRNNLLPKDKWLVTLSYIVQLAGGKEAEVRRASQLGERIYASFQGVDPRTQVRYNEFAAGLTTLCSGCTLEDKVMVAFTLVDNDSDGLISSSELLSLVLATLRVLGACSQVGQAKISSVNATLEEMAAAVVREAYSMFGLDLQDPVNMETVHEMCSDYVLLASGTRPDNRE